jgi:hypothetical protein
MEQLQVALAHLKAHRFWYSLGLACLFAYLVTGGTKQVVDEADRLEKQLEASYTAVKGYHSGDKANAQWKGAVAEKREVLDKDFASSHEKLYLDQEKLMTWPKEVAEAFKGRPFGARLDDNSSRHIFDYRRACDDYSRVAQVFWDLNVLDKHEDGKLFGVLDVGPNPSAVLTTTIKFPVWERDPTSMEAWYAQEMLWIQHAVIRSIAAVNRKTAETYEGEKAWLNAPIKRMYGIEIGERGLDQATASAKKDLIEYPATDPGQAPATPANQQSQGHDVNAKRYIEKTDVYRLVPVSVHLLIDQKAITEVLRGLANTDFKYTILESRINYPSEKVELPVLLKAAGVSLPGRGEENPLYNCVDLDVYGTMRIFEIPKSLKEQREKAAKGEVPPAPADAKPAEPPPAKTPDVKTDPAKAEAKAVGDAAKAAAPPPAEPAKKEGPKKEDPKKDDAKKEDAKKDDAKKEEPKKEDPKKDAGKEAAKDPTVPKDPTAGAGKKKN